MRFTQAAASRSLTLHRSPGERLIVSSHWALYGGLMGTVSPRSLGCATLYFADGDAFRFRSDGGTWQDTHFALAAPFVEHQIRACEPGQTMIGLMLETDAFDLDSVDRPALEALYQPLREVIERVTALGHPLAGRDQHEVADALDRYLKRKTLDPRVAAAVEQIRLRPWDSFSASDFAEDSCLSFSRFLHLFKEETALTFRRFVAWKRARYVLEQVRNAASLTAIAFDAGYPDSTHFSHSIRRAYGIQARELFSRCSSMPVYVVPQARAVSGGGSATV